MSGNNFHKVSSITVCVEYWNCSCEVNYIHHTSENKCKICKDLKRNSENTDIHDLIKFGIIKGHNIHRKLGLVNEDI